MIRRDLSVITLGLNDARNFGDNDKGIALKQAPLGEMWSIAEGTESKMDSTKSFNDSFVEESTLASTSSSVGMSQSRS